MKPVQMPCVPRALSRGSARGRFPLAFVTVALAGALGAVGCAEMNGPAAALTEKDNVRLGPVFSAMTDAEKDAFKRLYLEGERNAVLNFQSLGVAAMEAGHYATAERAFDGAIQRIERFYVKDAKAEQAKSTFSAESVKDFKGEPYERSMAYWYRGLLYARVGDWQNARAAFMQADWQDTVADKEQFQGDFGVMGYLAAWASACDRDMERAKDLHAQAAAKDPSITSLPLVTGALVIVEAGQGPFKAGEGKHRELLVIKDSPASVDTPIVVEPSTRGAPELVKVADVTWQGMTRGGRPIQGILDGKAQFKDTSGTVGAVALNAGGAAMMVGALSDNDALGQLGAVGSLLGLAATIASNAATPAADTRYWAHLPHDIWIRPAVALDAVGDAPLVKVQMAGGTETQVSAQAWPAHGQCRVVWARTRPGQPGAVHAIQGGRSPKDDVFRGQVVEQFRPEEKA